MNLLQPGNPLDAIRGKKRLPILDHRPPLQSPVTLLVMLLKAIGFRWYGAEKTLENGSTGTSCFLDTTKAFPDGTMARRIVWNFIGDDRVGVGGDPVSLVQVAHFFNYSEFVPEKNMPPGAKRVFRAHYYRRIARSGWKRCRLIREDCSCRNPLSAQTVMKRSKSSPPCWSYTGDFAGSSAPLPIILRTRSMVIPWRGIFATRKENAKVM